MRFIFVASVHKTPTNSTLQFPFSSGSQAMDSHYQTFYDVTAEKAIALKKYRRHQNVKSVLTACVALAPLFFTLSRSSALLPAAAHLFGDVSRELHVVFYNRFYVLSLVLVLLVAISALYRRNDADDDDDYARSLDFYNEFGVNSVYCQSIVLGEGVYPETEMENCRSTFLGEGVHPETETKANCRSIVVDSGECPETETTVEEVLLEVEKQMASSDENAVALSPSVDSQEPVTERKSSCVPPVAAITLVEKEKRYRRTQSGSFEKKRMCGSESSKRVMQRSETEIHRKTMSCREESARRWSSVEVLNDEEFNLRIQKFIDENKRSQREEETESEKRRKEEEEERRKTEYINSLSEEFINNMKKSQMEESRREAEERRRRREGKINMAVLSS
ncbi:unnamed protein product [Prunus armeniaca]